MSSAGTGLPAELLSAEAAARVLSWAYAECGIDGYTIAKAGRAELEAAAGTRISSLTYGEISIPSFLTLLGTLDSLQPPESAATDKPAAAGAAAAVGGSFVDIGSGTGKAVLAAALCLPLESAVGIEIVPKLHESAIAALEFLLAPPAAAAAGRPATTELAAVAALLAPDRVRFCCGDSFAAARRPDWQKASVLYAPSSCFDVDMMQSVATGCEGLLPGAIVITTTQQLPPRPGALRPIPASEQSLPYAKGRLTFYCYVAGPEGVVGGEALDGGAAGARERKRQRREKRKTKKKEEKRVRSESGGRAGGGNRAKHKQARGR